MKRKTLFNLSLLLEMMLLSSCRQEVKPQENYGYRFQGDTVKVLDSEWSRNLVVEEVKPLKYSKSVVTAGTIRPIPTQYAAIASPFSGRIVSSAAKMGQFVEKGTPLFEIICPDFTDAQKDYFQAQSSKELALKDLRRKEDLVKNGVSSQRELEEAQNALLIAEKDFENATAALKVYQVSDLSGMTLGQPLVVRAPISGLLIENAIVIGQYVKEDDEPVAVVADLSHVWVSAQVKEKDIRFVNEDAELEVELAAWPGVTIKGTVFHIEEEVDEDTRSIRVLSECENVDEMLKLNMYTTVHFVSDPIDMVEVPETALLQGPDDTFVFVRTAPDTYVCRNVKVEKTADGKAVISAGLEPGEMIIAAGGYYLKQ